MEEETRLDISAYLKVIEAKDIKATEFDSYATIKVDGCEVNRTRTVFNTITPFWEEEHLSNVSSGIKDMEVVVWEVKGRMFQDQPLGKIVLDLEALKATDGVAQEKWLPLYPADTEGSVSGVISLDLLLTDKSLTVNLLSGNNLAVADVNGFSDPYVVFHLLPDPNSATQQKSSIKKKTLNPKYQEKFEFHFDQILPNHTLLATVWDWDRFTEDDFLGYFVIPFTDLTIGKKLITTMALRPKPVPLSLAMKGSGSIVDLSASSEEFPKTPVSVPTTPNSATSEKHQATKATSFAKIYQQLPKELEHPKTSLGSIRVKYKYTEEVILPETCYKQFLDAMVGGDFLFPVLLGKVSNEREDAAWALVKYFHRAGEAVTFLSAIMHHEVDATLDPNTIFRGNSMTSKAIDVYMKLIALTYLHETVGDLVKDIVTSKKSFEVDPTRLEKTDDIKKNWKYAKGMVEQILDAIFKSKEKLPANLTQVFSNLRSSVMKKWPDDHVVPYTAVSGFIFLRLFVAAILSPNLFGLWNEIPDQKASRNLTIVAKTVQNVANLVPFGQKEAFMEEMNEVIKERIPEMKKFLEDISVPKEDPTTSRREGLKIKTSFFFKKKEKHSTVSGSKALQSFVESDLNKECALIYQHFNRNFERLKEEFEREPRDNALLQNLKAKLDALNVLTAEAKKKFL